MSLSQFPEFYYYESEQFIVKEEISQQSDGSQQLDVNRSLSEGSLYWRQQELISLEAVKKPKTLILNCQFNIPDFKDTVWAEKMEEGHLVFIVATEHGKHCLKAYTPLTEAELSSNHTRVPGSEVCILINDAQLNPDHCLIVDDKLLHQLQAEYFEQTQISDFRDMPLSLLDFKKLSMDTIEAALLEQGLFRIVIDEFPEANQLNSLKLLLSRNPSFEIFVKATITATTALKINNFLMEISRRNLYLTFYPYEVSIQLSAEIFSRHNLIELSVSGYAIKLPDEVVFDKLESLEWHAGSVSGTLRNILCMAENLKTLTIYFGSSLIISKTNDKIVDDRVLPFDKDLSCLEELCINSYKKFNDSFMSSIISHAPQLKVLSVQFMNEPIDIDLPILKELRSLNLFMCTMSLRRFLLLLDRAKKLTHLKLEKVEFVLDTEMQLPLMEKLETVVIKESPYVFEAISLSSHQTPNLQKLSVTLRNKGEIACDLHLFQNLRRLQWCSLDEDDFEKINNFKHFLRWVGMKAPNLTELTYNNNLYNTWNNLDVSTLLSMDDAPILPYLKKISFSAINMRADFLERFLTGNSDNQLCSLYLMNLRVEGEGVSVKKFQQMKELKLSDVSFSEGWLHHLIKRMPALQKLILYQNSIQELLDPQLSFDLLQSVHFDGWQISSEDIQEFLSRIPGLREIMLNNFDEDEDPEGYPKNLREVLLEEYGDKLHPICWVEHDSTDNDATLNTQVFESVNLDTNTVEDADEEITESPCFRGFFTGKSVENERQRDIVYPIDAVFPAVNGPLFSYVAPTEDMLESVTYEVWGNIDSQPECMKEITQQFDFEFQKGNYYLGVVKLVLNHMWQPLPSLSTQEMLLAVYGQGVLVKYSVRHRQYFIKSLLQDEHGVEQTIHYLIKSSPDLTQTDLPPELRDIVDYFHRFGSGVLEVPPGANNQQIIHAIQYQKVGACRHRAPAFIEYVKRMYVDRGYPHWQLWAVFNEVHAFVEMCLHPLSGAIYQVQLGGFEYKAVLSSGLETHSETQCELIQAPDTLKPWLQQAERPYQEIIDCLVRGQERRVRVTFNQEHVEAHFVTLLQQAYSDAHTEHFCVSSPSVLQCQYAQVSLDREGQVSIKKAPAGPLFDFIHARTVDQKQGVLIIRWDNFEPQKLIQSNTVIDNDFPQIDGVRLPPNVRVISIQTLAHTNAYVGADFISRQDILYRCESYGLQVAAQALLAALEPATEADLPEYSINLYHSNNWRPLLEGGLNLTDTLTYQHSLLTRLDGKRAKVIIQNKPKCDDFEEWMRQLKVNKGKVVIWDRVFDFSGICFEYVEAYDWQVAVENTEWLQLKEVPQDLPRLVFILNPETANLLWQGYAFVSDTSGGTEGKGRAVTLPGYLAMHQREGVLCYVTHALPLDMWSRVFDTAKAQDVRLSIVLAPGLRLPVQLELAGCVLGEQSEMSAEGYADDYPQIVCTNDMTLSLRHWIQKTSADVVKEITDSEINFLLCSQEARLETEPVRFDITWTESDVYKALFAGKTVLLKGSVSLKKRQQLASLLAPQPHFMRNNRPEYFSGRLILITDNPKTDFLFSASVSEEHISMDARWEALAIQHASDKLAALKKKIGLGAEFSISQLEALLMCSELSWDPLLRTTYPLDIQLAEFDIDTAEREAAVLQTKKINTLLEGLAVNRTTVIVGPTGCGKTTLLKQLAKDAEHFEVYWGKEHLKAWAVGARQVHGKKRIYFQDEANTEAADYQQFEDMYNPTSGIWIKGTFYPLGADDVVVFACNPVSYGNRKLPRLFSEHGGILEYTTILANALYVHSLKPILDTLSLSHEQKQSCAKILLAVYEYILQLSSSTVRISPRELEAMALFFASTYNEQGQADAELLCLRAVALIADTLILEKEKEDFYSWFEKQTSYPMENLLSMAMDDLILPQTGAFVFLPEHAMGYLLLNNLLKAKQYRSEHALPVQGLNQLIIQGDSGVGKSAFVLHCMQLQGYTICEVQNRERPLSAGEKRCYYLPAILSLDVKQQLLDCALEQGAAIVVEEVNSQALENCVNNFSLGIASDGRFFEQTHSLLVGTQNDAAKLKGRHQSSNAEQRRQLKVMVKAYSVESIQRILQHWGLPDTSALILAEQYQKVVAYAIKKGFVVPTLRDLERELKAQVALREAEWCDLWLQEPLSLEEIDQILSGFSETAQFNEVLPINAPHPLLLSQTTVAEPVHQQTESRVSEPADQQAESRKTKRYDHFPYSGENVRRRAMACYLGNTN